MEGNSILLSRLNFLKKTYIGLLLERENCEKMQENISVKINNLKLEKDQTLKNCENQKMELYDKEIMLSKLKMENERLKKVRETENLAAAKAIANGGNDTVIARNHRQGKKFEYIERLIEFRDRPDNLHNLTDLKARIETLKNEISPFDDSLSKIKKQIDDLNTKLNNATQRIYDINEEIPGLFPEINCLTLIHLT